MPEGQIRWQVIAVAGCGAIVGYGETGRDPRMEPGHFWLQIVVDPAYRNRGIGTMLYDDVARFAWEMGATHLTSDMYGDQREALCFAKRRGFIAERAGDKRVRLQLNITAGVPPSPREAVKARYREFYFELAMLEARS
jgi:GNAT superfamily N-acetyltransferase